MAVPSSGPISFGLISENLSPPASAPLSLHEMSLQAGFSAPDGVGEFYGYSPGGGVVAFNITINGDYDPSKSCAVGPGEPSQQVYWTGPGYPATNQFVYSDIDLIYPFDGQGLWFYLFENNTVIQIYNDGKIMDTFMCKG